MYALHRSPLSCNEAKTPAPLRPLPFRLSAHLARRIALEGGDGPLTRQFVPTAAEAAVAPEELTDPIGDETFSPCAGIVHRYGDRVLLKPTHQCPAYCRFCFRRESVGPDGLSLSPAQLDAALAYIANHGEIWEVILSGGEPMMLPAAKLRAILSALDAMPHVAIVRVHTRAPVMEPALITAEKIALLAQTQNCAVHVVLHCNHADELDAPALDTCRAIVKAGVPMFSQSVLLKGINDDAMVLEKLMRTLLKNRIKPYYLHHADLARGTAHFRTGIEEGQALMRALRARLSGLAQPVYVLDIPGGAGKVPLTPAYLEAGGAEEKGVPGHRVNDPAGERHFYPSPKP